MLSHSQQSLLRKLSARKHRWSQKLFLGEGRKVVQELMDAGLKPHLLVAEEGCSWAETADVQLSKSDFKAWSKLEATDEVFGVFPFPDFTNAEIPQLTLVLDNIRDPGNLGTIIRSCDWFGIKQVFCTKGSTDAFNSKAVQSSMGSVARVQVIYEESELIYAKLAASHTLLCADMVGSEVNDLSLSVPIALVMGSESHGPSPFWKEHASPITIPRGGNSQTESLNVAIATAILLSHLRFS